MRNYTYLMKYLLLFLGLVACSCTLSARTFQSVTDGYWHDPYVWISAEGQAAVPSPDDDVIISHEIIHIETGVTYVHRGNVRIEAEGAYLINTGKGGPNAYIFAGKLFDVYGVLITSDDFSHQKGVWQGDGLFYAHEGAVISIGDDFEPHERSLTINEVECFALGDDLKFFGAESFVCGYGHISIGPITDIPGTANGEVRAIIDGVDFSGFPYVCSDIVVYRVGERGQTCEVPVQPGTGNPPPTLPVEWLSFEAHPGNEGVLLDWTTAMEVNNDYFVVERGRSLAGFQAIGEVPGQGTTHVVSRYEFLDTDRLHGEWYYRLRQVDLDGQVQYSPVIQVGLWPREAGMEVFPNPTADGNLRVSLYGLPAHGRARLRILDLQGRRVREEQLRLDARGTFDGWILSALPPGTYSLTCEVGGQQFVRKLISQ